MSVYSHIFYRGVFFDKHSLVALPNPPKRGKILYVCELDKLIKLTCDMPISLHTKTQQATEEMIESIYTQAHKRGIIDSSHTYSLYFSCKPHFYDENLQECEAYFIDHDLFAQLPKHLKLCEIAVDAHFLASHIQQGFVYIRESQMLYLY